MLKHLIHWLLILLLISFALLFAAPPWDQGFAWLAFGILFVITAAVLIRALIGWMKSKDDDAAAGTPVTGKIRVWVLFVGGAVTIVLFAVATLKANDTLTALAIGPRPLRVVPTQVDNQAPGSSKENPSTIITYEVDRHSHTFAAPSQDTDITKAQALLAVSPSDPGHASLYSDWKAGRESGAVGQTAGFTLGFVVAAVATRELGWPRKRRQAPAHPVPKSS